MGFHEYPYPWRFTPLLIWGLTSPEPPYTPRPIIAEGRERPIDNGHCNAQPSRWRGHSRRHTAIGHGGIRPT